MVLIVTDLNNILPLGIMAVDVLYETDWRKIIKLDCSECPGLSEKEFFGLFTKCNACRLVVACQVFHCHHCSCRLLGEDGLELTDCEE